MDGRKIHAALSDVPPLKDTGAPAPTLGPLPGILPELPFPIGCFQLGTYFILQPLKPGNYLFFGKHLQFAFCRRNYLFGIAGKNLFVDNDDGAFQESVLFQD